MARGFHFRGISSRDFGIYFTSTDRQMLPAKRKNQIQIAGRDEMCIRDRLYLDGAIQHAKDAGIPDFLSEIEDPKYNLYVYAMGAYLYDNRGFELSSGNAGGALNNLKIQMRRELMLRRKRTEETT